MGLLKWDGATAGGRRARLIIVFRTLKSDVLGLLCGVITLDHLRGMTSNFACIPPMRCPLYAPCLSLVCNPDGKAPCYPLDTLYW